MNQDVSHLALVCGVTAAINAVSANSRGKEPIVSLMASSVGFVGLSVFGGLTGHMEVATAIAYVFLISALLLRGMPFLTTTRLIASGSGKTMKAVQK